MGLDWFRRKKLSSPEFNEWVEKMEKGGVSDEALKASINEYFKNNHLNIPTELPNPNPLTFTGAVTGSYDGSTPLSVEIPSGGGIEASETVTIIDYTLTANDMGVKNITFTTENYPELANYNHLFFYFNCETEKTSAFWNIFNVNDKLITRCNSKFGFSGCIEINGNYAMGWSTNGNSTKGTFGGMMTNDATLYGKGYANPQNIGGTVNSISITVYDDTFFQEGDRLTVKGFNF